MQVRFGTQTFSDGKSGTFRVGAFTTESSSTIYDLIFDDQCQFLNYGLNCKTMTPADMTAYQSRVFTDLSEVLGKHKSIIQNFFDGHPCYNEIRDLLEKESI